MTVGTQAAVLAGLDVAMLIEFSPPSNNEFDTHVMLPLILKFLYYVMIVAAFGNNISVLAHTTACSVLSGSLALRGPDGSMMIATDGLYEERKEVYAPFQNGLALTVSSCCLGVWLILNWEAAMVGMIVAAFTYYKIHSLNTRVRSRFYYNHSDTVDFKDIFEGPANIIGIPTPNKTNNSTASSPTSLRASPTQSTTGINIKEKNSFESYHVGVDGDTGIDLEKDVDSNEEDEEQELLERGNMRKRASPPSSKRRWLW
eukprot:CAMPEP_0195286652 /NCGR_PEP_ID=MMETSP0707-20130614/4034_1 /TAXON_ID=33640 /ORGANISM="Asterionellopsis glacialis, Strain CCMP134" /LENGTH=257 /DNA_ID=CAMNT_0040346325 /DNA_START=339 /DNA_END=1112 /DNA_ORIENTATION=+